MKKAGWMRLWIGNVWKQRPGHANERSLLVWDSFRSHTARSTRSCLRECKVEAAVIPGGLTSILQPLDVSLNKPFKNHIREEWTTWMTNGQHTFTAGGYMRAPSFAELCHFVINAWNKIGAETGTEDDELWDSGESEGVGSESGSVSAIEELVEEEELSTEADPSTRDRARPGGLHDGFPFYWLYALMAKWQLHERWCLIPSGERVLSIRRQAVPSQRL
uniref:DDE-1 domain-containing protein n=1 Tax=Trichuris muris TaxID=70415 RepID=A0A5S6QG38_TRIMR